METIEWLKGNKGKWTAVNTVGDNYNIEVDGDDGTHIIANVSGEYIAELIAIAPQLLKQLIACNKALETEGYPAHDRREIVELINKAMKQ